MLCIVFASMETEENYIDDYLNPVYFTNEK